MKKNHILICIISSAHGIKGEVKIRSFIENDKNFKKYKFFEDETGKEYLIEYVSNIGNSTILKIENIDSRNKAESLIGLNLFINKKYLDENEEDEFYYYQLIGMNVISNGEKIGIVKNIHNFGAGDIIEIINNKNKTEFYSFNKEVISNIVVKDNYLEIILPSEI